MTPRLGTPEQFAAVREFLGEAGYTADAICARLGISRLSESLRMPEGGPPEDRLGALLALFLLGGTVDARRFIPATALEACAALGLLEGRAGGVTATVEMYPAAGLYVISDRNRGAELPPGADKVFSAITPNTEEFLAMLPGTPCPAFLELCSGAGVAALAAARDYAVHSFAYDITERSTHFAEFNRRLNGIANATIARGDLYRPAGRRTFDRIAAHPPYVPSLRRTEVLRDGGEIGEDLTQRIVAGLPQHLHPGGRLYLLALIAETPEETVAQKVRRWLHHAEPEFDVAVVARKRLEPARVIIDNWSERHAEPGDVLRWQGILRHSRIQAFVYSTVVVERHAEARAAVTVQQDPLWDARPRCVGPEWMAGVVQRCDGTRTCRELQPEGVEPAEFERVMRELVGKGLVRL